MHQVWNVDRRDANNMTKRYVYNKIRSSFLSWPAGKIIPSVWIYAACLIAKILHFSFREAERFKVYCKAVGLK